MRRHFVVFACFIKATFAPIQPLPPEIIFKGSLYVCIHMVNESNCTEKKTFLFYTLIKSFHFKKQIGFLFRPLIIFWVLTISSPK